MKVKIINILNKLFNKINNDQKLKIYTFLCSFCDRDDKPRFKYYYYFRDKKLEMITKTDQIY